MLHHLGIFTQPNEVAVVVHDVIHQNCFVGAQVETAFCGIQNGEHIVRLERGGLLHKQARAYQCKMRLQRTPRHRHPLVQLPQGCNVLLLRTKPHDLLTISEV